MQTAFMGVTDKVAMISAADIGDPTSPYGDIHPRNKTEGETKCKLCTNLSVVGFYINYVSRNCISHSLYTIDLVKLVQISYCLHKYLFTVGRRMAQAASSLLYGNDISFCGPWVESGEVSGTFLRVWIRSNLFKNVHSHSTYCSWIE